MYLYNEYFLKFNAYFSMQNQIQWTNRVDSLRL